MNPTIQEILEDAKLVAAHGARAGCFARDEPLMDALGAAVAKGPALAWSDPEFGKLQQALSQATRAILPVTLYDLKSGWRSDQDNTPAGFWRIWRTTIKTVVLGFTIALLFICAVSTIWQQQAKQILIQFANKKEELQATAVNDLFPLIATLGEEEAVKLNDPSSGIRLALRIKTAEISALDAAIMEDLGDYAELMGDVPFRDFRMAVLGWTERVFADDPEPEPAIVPTGGEETVATETLTPASADANPSYETNSLRKIQNIIQSSGAAQEAGDDPCAGQNGFDLTLDTVADAGGLDNLMIYTKLVESDIAHFERIKCRLGLQYLPTPIGYVGDTGPALPVRLDLGAISHSVEVFGVWLLPALYGMLGALIYHLRNYLNHLRPDPSPLKVFLRVWLGGFAGVAVGWFWLPKDGEALGVADITLTTLTLAFLVGFAIDVFFNLLDRIVTLLNAWVGNLGAATVK